MKVLVIGSGGREHALAWKLKQSPHVTKIYCAPGNAGTRELGENIDLPAFNFGALAVWAVQHQIDLTVVGPEAPLADGIVDIFQEHGLKIFGPTKAAAQLEASKAFSKEVMLKSGVKTPAARIFTSHEEAKAYLKSRGAPIVVKADGLAAGKGVVVAETIEEAEKALDDLMLHSYLGKSGQTVILEERIVGKEASVMVLVDDDTILPLVVSQDYKRLLDDDQGPNTGGMGAISPTPVLADKEVENLVGDLFVPVIQELLSRGIRYRGFLYAGVIVDAAGVVRVLEFNCRLGDPETQALMMRMKSDFFEVLDAAVHGRLKTVDVQWHQDATACIVIASGGYPSAVDDGKVITGTTENIGDAVVFHAGTRFDESRHAVLSKGGRVLGVTARGKNIDEAIGRAYKRIEGIRFEGMQYRHDIGRSPKK